MIKENNEFKDLPILGKKPSDEKEEKYLREVREFQFSNISEAGVCHKFVYGDAKKHKKFVFFHDQVYKVPRFIARHIEECSTPLYEWRPDGLGNLTKKFIGSQRRFQMREVFRGS